ncbi:MAG TPA: ABC transporter ATP-binding protein [Actinomycetes bacterium]|jgi:branched-chain amino acid transport system ATP-binding protein|nr:ABC transporter ATP-binding protein [Actinomycetes bacterium]
MLSVEQVHTFRGQSYVLQGVTLQVPDGACTTLLGRNGMGKTTLIRSLMGLTPPRSGHIRLNGVELSGREPFEIAQMGLALVPQGRHIFPSLTVEENLRLGQRKASNGQAWDLDRVYEVFPNLKQRRQNRGGELSGGEQQMLAIGRALMTNPRILLMDEPSEGLAPVIVERVEKVIRALREQELSILLVEQNYRLGVAMADHLYILSKGVVVWEGLPEELEASEEVRQTHLGT